MKKTLHAFAHWLWFLPVQRAGVMLSAVVLLVFLFAWPQKPDRPVSQARAGAMVSSSSENLNLSRSPSSHADMMPPLIESEPSLAVQELDHLLRRGDLCGFLEGWRANQVTTRELAALLPNDQSSALQIGRALFQNPKSLSVLAHESEAARFIYALNVSGLFALGESGSDGVENLPLGFELLSKLIREHPDNGAYPAYRAVVRSHRNESRDQIQKDLQLAALAPEFEMHLRSLTRPLFEWGLRSPAHYVAGISILSALPIANYSRLLAVIRREVGAGDEAFADQMESLGRKIMQYQDVGSERREFVDWIAIEYQTGLHIAQVGWTKNHPNEELPAELRKTYRDIYKMDPSLEALEPIFSPDWRCDPVRAESVLDYEMNRERSRSI